jgi:hypothetical protein
VFHSRCDPAAGRTVSVPGIYPKMFLYQRL